jgi:hypothetical protein
LPNVNINTKWELNSNEQRYYDQQSYYGDRNKEEGCDEDFVDFGDLIDHKQC